MDYFIIAQKVYGIRTAEAQINASRTNTCHRVWPSDAISDEWT